MYSKQDFTLRLVLAALFLVLFSGRTTAAPLDPMRFASLGDFPTLAGGYSLNTSETPTLMDPMGNVITGVVHVTDSGQEIAVFTFNSITLDGMTIYASGSRPVALLSQDFARIGSTGAIRASGGGGAQGTVYSWVYKPGGFGGPGGGGGGSTYGWGGGPGGGISPIGRDSGGGGGGFGGQGGNGIFSYIYYLGGAAYGDLTLRLEGGSGGAGHNLPSGSGGGGGGGVEVGAVNGVSISGSVLADGGHGGPPIYYPWYDGGGGSGGGIIVHGASVSLTGTLSAVGGGAGVTGGSGGGGRVYIHADHFDYAGTINVDGGGDSDAWYGSFGAPGVITISAATINHIPVANAGDDQTVEVPHDGNPGTSTTSVTLNGTLSSDPDNDTLTYAWDDGQGHTADGVQPTLDLPVGTYSFTLTATDAGGLSVSDSVTITVTPELNDAPSASDMSVSTNRDTSTNIALDGLDLDGDTLRYAVTNPAHGTLSYGSDGNLVYTPNAGYVGADGFDFLAIDPYGLISDFATVSITVIAVNRNPVANNPLVTTNEDTAKGITLTATDPDGDSLTYAIGIGPSHGTLSGVAPNLTYTPAPNYNGSDRFTFTVSDGKGGVATGTVSLTVAAVNDNPVANPDAVSTPKNTSLVIAVLANDGDVDGNTLAVTSVTQPANGTVVRNANGTVTFTPKRNDTGTVTFSYTISDGQGGTASATVTVTVTR